MRPEPVLPDDARLYRAVFERSLGISFVLSIRGELERANATALTLAGRSLETLVGKRLDEMPWWPAAEEERQRLREGVERATTGESVFVDTVLHAADGRDLDVDLSCQPIHGKRRFAFRDARSLETRIGSGELLLVRRRDELAHRRVGELARVQDRRAPHPRRDRDRRLRRQS